MNMDVEQFESRDMVLTIKGVKALVMQVQLSQELN